MAKLEPNEELDFQVCQYLDGQLDERERRQFEDRLKTDAQLAEALRMYRSLEGRLEAMGQQEVPGIDYDAQRSAIMADLERQALLTKPKSRVFLFRPAFMGSLAAAAMVLLAVMAGIKWFNTTETVPVIPSAAQPVVTAGIVPPILPQAGDGVVNVTYARMTPADVPQTLPPASSIPSGTVMVSITEPSETSAGSGGFMDFD